MLPKPIDARKQGILPFDIDVSGNSEERGEYENDGRGEGFVAFLG